MDEYANEGGVSSEKDNSRSDGSSREHDEELLDDGSFNQV
ncbi:unnamed protein product, partial [Allacma fusca]